MYIEENMELDAIINQAQSQIDAAEDAATLDQVRVEFMGRKVSLPTYLKGLESYQTKNVLPRAKN